MRQITLTSDTIKKIQNYLNDTSNFDLDPYEGSDTAHVEDMEFDQGDDAIFLNADVHAHYDECINDRYGGYVDDCSEWVVDSIDVNDICSYDEDGNRIEVTNADKIAA